MTDEQPANMAVCGCTVCKHYRCCILFGTNDRRCITCVCGDQTLTTETRLQALDAFLDAIERTREGSTARQVEDNWRTVDGARVIARWQRSYLYEDRS